VNASDKAAIRFQTVNSIQQKNKNAMDVISSISQSLRRISKTATSTFFLIVSGILLPYVDGATLEVGENQHFKTISAAVAAASEGDVILVHQGTYREKVEVTKNNLTIQAFNADHVLVTGLDLVKGDWSRFKDNIYKIAAPIEVTDIFVDGLNMDKARFPHKNSEDDRLSYADAAETVTGGADEKTRKAQVTFKDLKAPSNYWVGGSYFGRNGANPWTATCGKILESQGGTLSVDSHAPQWANGRGVSNVGKGHGFIINCLNALGAPKEWHWQEGQLYLCPPQSDDPKGHKVEARTRLYVFEAKGISGLKLKGLNLKAGSILIDDSKNCSIDGCTIRYPGPWSDYNYGHDFGGIKDGTYGVAIGGENNTIKNCYIARTWGAAVTLYGTNDTCENCFIEYANWLGRRDGAVHCVGEHNRVTRCTIRYAGRDGIDGGNRTLGYNLIAMHLTIDHCDIRDVGIMATDCGPVYVNSQGPTDIGLTVAYNTFFGNNNHNGMGLYIDNGTSGVLCHHNIIGDMGSHLINPHGSKSGIKIYNNLLIRSAQGIAILPNAGTTAINNITDASVLAKTHKDSKDVKEKLQGSHNILNAKPSDFIDYAHGDFHPSKSSPALGAGVVIPGICESPDGKPNAGPYASSGPDSKWVSGSSLSVPIFADEPGYVSKLPTKIELKTSE
jgi:hypothetical protein